MLSGIRWAETTSTSTDTSNSASAVAAAPMTGQSESDPMTMPTRGVGAGSSIRISLQIGRGVPSTPSGAIEIIAEGSDVADLASRSDLLAVELHPELAIPGEAMQQRRRKIIDRAAENVDHHRPRHSGTRIAQREIEYRPQMVLELRGVRAVDSPVTRVVRTHGQLVDQDRAVGPLHQFDGEHADHAKFGGDGQGKLLCPGGLGFGQAWRRGDRLDADPIALHRFRDRIGRGLAGRGADHQSAQFAGEVDKLLGDDLYAVREVTERVGGLGSRVDPPDTLSVVAAAGRLGDHRPAMVVPERD